MEEGGEAPSGRFVLVGGGWRIDDNEFAACGCDFAREIG